eukprot:1161850-Pelagomonas_calceolata.AAC.13
MAHQTRCGCLISHMALQTRCGCLISHMAHQTPIWLIQWTGCRPDRNLIWSLAWKDTVSGVADIVTHVIVAWYGVITGVIEVGYSACMADAVAACASPHIDLATGRPPLLRGSGLMLRGAQLCDFQVSSTLGLQPFVDYIWYTPSSASYQARMEQASSKNVSYTRSRKCNSNAATAVPVMLRRGEYACSQICVWRQAGLDREKLEQALAANSRHALFQQVCKCFPPALSHGAVGKRGGFFLASTSACSDVGAVLPLWPQGPNALPQGPNALPQGLNASAAGEAGRLHGGLRSSQSSALRLPGSGAGGSACGAVPARVIACRYSSQSDHDDSRTRGKEGTSDGGKSAAGNPVPKCGDGGSGNGSAAGAGAHGGRDGDEGNSDLSADGGRAAGAGGTGAGAGCGDSAAGGTGAGGAGAACGRGDSTPGGTDAKGAGAGDGSGDPAAGGTGAGAGSSDSAATQQELTVGLRPLRVLLPPDSSRFPAGMPNPRWPSDHVSLVCDFLLHCGHCGP